MYSNKRKGASQYQRSLFPLSKSSHRPNSTPLRLQGVHAESRLRHGAAKNILPL